MSIVSAMTDSSDEWAPYLDARGDMIPPWARFPEIAVASIGWRMGSGQDWLLTWYAWIDELPRDEATRRAYLLRHPPAPRSWTYELDRVLHPRPSDDDDHEDEDDNEREELDDEGEGDDEYEDELDDEDEDDEYEDEDEDEDEEPTLDLSEGGRYVSSQTRAWLEAGIVADDAAYTAWEALHGANPRVPWDPSANYCSLYDAVDVDTRELNFFARWGVAQRERGTLAAWLASAPPAGDDWRAFLEAMSTGTCPDELETADALGSATTLAVTLAAEGVARPPWRLGISTPTRSLSDVGGYSRRWCLWLLGVFDDWPSERAYLRACEPIPEGWRDWLARELRWHFS